MGLASRASATTSSTTAPTRCSRLARRARFDYLAANVRRTAPAAARDADGPRRAATRVGFVGVTLERHAERGRARAARPGSPSPTRRRRSTPPRATCAPRRRRGLALVHEGGEPAARTRTAAGPRGPIVGIAARLRGVDAVVSGHTHDAYVCRIGRRPRHLGRRLRPHGHGARPGLRPRPAARGHRAQPRGDARRPRRPGASRIVAERGAAAAAGRRLRGSTLARTRRGGRVALGDVVADAQRAATGGRPGADEPGQHPRGPSAAGPVTDDLFAVQPFGAQLVTRTFTGAELRRDPRAAVRPPRTRRTRSSRSRPASPTPTTGDDVTDIAMNGRPLAPGRPRPGRAQRLPRRRRRRLRRRARRRAGRATDRSTSTPWPTYFARSPARWRRAPWTASAAEG